MTGVVLIILLLLPLAATLQRDTDGRAMHMNKRLPRSFMDILKQRKVMSRFVCPWRQCTSLIDCPSLCNYCTEEGCSDFPW
uniref:Ubs_35 putative toxin n=1 Tax=Unedogemmula bisaya TaxID=746885 RepID=A0A098LWH8_UNEBI